MVHAADAAGLTQRSATGLMAGRLHGMTARSTTLVLIPTELELRELAPLLQAEPGLQLELCGFGPIAAAARTSELLARLRPARVLLLGIAGSLAETGLSLGQAYEFAAVQLDGLGAGLGANYRSASELGWVQWPGKVPATAIGEQLGWNRSAGSQLCSLCVCAASSSAQERELRRARYPGVAVEEMEGFGVALACALQATPLCMLRGISNIAGTRDKELWQTSQALSAVGRLAQVKLLQAAPWAVPAPRGAC